MLNLEVLDRELDDRKGVKICGADDVGNVAVDEDVARLEAEDGGFRAARVGTPNPQDFGVLAVSEGREEIRVGFGRVGCPGFVGLKQSRVCI